ncbi:MAG: 1-acyl-sn-glycerol-3-phosphate acyltransferase [Pseudomonadota bacterium]
MFEETVSLPLWLVVLAGLLALVALLDRLLVPSARWFLHRRVRQAIARANERLTVQIPFFALTERRILIDNLAYDPEVLDEVEAESQRSGAPHELVVNQALAYAREIVPAFNAYVYFKLGTWLARRLARNLYRVRLHAGEEGSLADWVKQGATLVFVINHRSNMDYVLLAFLAARRTTLSFAAGDWARVWPLQSLVRAMGAYFVRRPRPGEAMADARLYRKVLQRYVQMATAGGVTQALFPEGRLSRDGGPGAPKLGLIDYMTRRFQPGVDREIVFVPVGINYDQVLEDRELVADAAQATRQSTRRAMWSVSRFLVRNLIRSPRTNPRYLGYASVHFGPGISLSTYLVSYRIEPGASDDEARRAAVAGLGKDLMTAIARQIPATPLPLVARLLVEAEGPTDRSTLEARLVDAIALLEDQGALVQLPDGGGAAALDWALARLLERGLAEETAGGYRPRAEAADLLAFYAHSIAHHFNPPESGRKPR